MRRVHALEIATAFVLVLRVGTTVHAAALPPGPNCENKAAASLRSCVRTVTKQQLTCFQLTGSACLPGDTKIARAMQRLEDAVLAKCPDAATMALAGYPAALTPPFLVDRLQGACTDATTSLVARAFGGPHGAVRASAAPADKTCLDTTFDQGRKLIDYAMRTQTKCVVNVHVGKTCDPVDVAAKIAARRTRTATTITGVCPDLADLITIDPLAYTVRATDQTECMVATAQSQTAPLSLSCGPRVAIPVPSLATNTQVVLDSNTWGTRCGDGSDFAFWVRLAPAGQPVGNVVVFMAGGGSCVDGPDCLSQGADLFESLSDGMTQTGAMSNTNVDSQYLNWTKVFIPYCTQDQHTGGGIVNVFPEMTVYRYGALNVRAAMRYVRDVLWASMDGSDPEGFRPDRMRVLFTGSSAGGGGAQFNYHYLLDDLRWIHTTLVADSSFNLDNGTGFPAVKGALALSSTTPGWNALAMAPPYCHAPECAEIWNTMAFAQSPRLLAVPDQQILYVSNQVDSTQKAVGSFSNMGSFVNAMRTKYCEQMGTPGLHSFLSASSTSEHGNINENGLYDNLTIGGTRMREWLGQAMSSPETMVDKIATGTIVPDVNFALPFPCAVGSPSGAFVDAP